MTDFDPTPRTTLKRRAQRGSYDRALVEAILDEALVSHVGFVVDGQPYVLPMAHVRVGDALYVHGSASNRMLRALGTGQPACVTVTLLDGLVLARAAFHNSMNYRSVVVLGRAEEVVDPAEKRRALEALVEHLAPGRTGDTRAPSEQELKASMMIRVAISEVSAKIRSGPPVDDEADYALPHWAGVVPLRVERGVPVADARVAEGTGVPEYLRR